MDKKERLEEVFKKCTTFDNVSDKENFLIDIFVKAEEKEEYDIIFTIAKHLTSEDNIDKYSSTFSTHNLCWLIGYTINRIKKSTDKKEEEIFYYELEDYLWMLKWVVPNIPDNLQTTKKMISKYSDIMKFCYEKLELNLAPYYKALTLQNCLMGNYELATENYKLWQDTEKDYTDNCEACEINDKIFYLTFIKKYDEALKLSEKIFSDNINCEDTPYSTYSSTIYCMIKLDKKEEAKNLLHTAIEKIKTKQEATKHLSDMMILSGFLDEPSILYSLAKDYASYILKNFSDLNILKVHTSLAKFDEDNYDHALELASLFDERNENNYYTNFLAEYTGRDKVKKIIFKK